MEPDGLSGDVSDHVESDRFVEHRPAGTYVRVAHFPYDDCHIEDTATADETGACGSPDRIPLGEAYEVTVWNGGDVNDSFGHLCGAKAACERAVAVADELDCRVWNPIRRHRTEAFVWEDEVFETLSGQYAVGVRPTQTEDFEDAHVAVDRQTGMAAWGSTRDDALDRLEEDTERYEETDRSGEIVETDGVLGGDPRIDGTRLGVLHIVWTYEREGSIVETAAQYGGLTVDEVRCALAWAERHPDHLERLRAERELLREWMQTHWEHREIDGTGSGMYRRPDDLEVTFDEFKRRRGFDR